MGKANSKTIIERNEIMLNALAKTINRHQWISEAAYFLAEARSFVPGKELDDWLEAEIVYSEMLITVYIAMLEEDRAAITISGLKQLASLIGVLWNNPQKCSF
jgi:hypothetical protein